MTLDFPVQVGRRPFVNGRKERLDNLKIYIPDDILCDTYLSDSINTSKRDSS